MPEDKDNFSREFEELKKLLAEYLKDVQRLKRRNEIMESAILSAFVTTICWILIHWKGW